MGRDTVELLSWSREWTKAGHERAIFSEPPALIGERSSGDRTVTSNGNDNPKTIVERCGEIAKETLAFLRPSLLTDPRWPVRVNSQGGGTE